MILEEETFKKFGYYPRDLKPHSHKRILAKCDDCRIVRETSKHNYRGLCKSCVKKGKLFSKKAKEKMRDAAIKRFENPANHPWHGKHRSIETKEKIGNKNRNRHPTKKTKEKMQNAHIGHLHSIETKHKMSDARKGIFCGENCPAWKGGISFEPYCIKFNNEFKERVREFWNRKCVICKKDEKENGRKLCVHHVDYNKNSCCDDSTPLFVTLCNSCHPKINFNEKYWKKYFIEMIFRKNKNGKCFYSEEEMYGKK